LRGYLVATLTPSSALYTRSLRDAILTRAPCRLLVCIFTFHLLSYDPMEDEKTNGKAVIVESMFKAGAQYGYRRSRRHPSISPYIFGVKNSVEIFDLEKTSDLLAIAKAFVEKLASEGKPLLFVCGKSEGQQALQEKAESIAMPYVIGRWVGGTLTNLPEIRKRVERLEMLREQREKGELEKYTKKEQLLIDREIGRLEDNFNGIVSMKNLPPAIFVVDPRKEDTAVREAHRLGIPVVGLCGSDCDLKGVEYPIAGNDSSRTSISFFIGEIVEAYKQGKAKQPVVAPDSQATDEKGGKE
jgi:small subunit ribosomal protein S2